METIDNTYYENFNQMHQSFYDWERQIINLGCNETDINISAFNSINDEGIKQASKLVHEYIHFLQNFCTAWGAPVFTDFALAYQKIGASSFDLKEEFKPPFDFSQSKNQLLIDGLDLRNQVIARMNKCNNIQYIDRGTLSPFKKVVNENCAVLTNGIVETELGIKVIREHMAQMGHLLFMKKSDDQIHEYNKVSVGFHNDKNAFSVNPEYWIVFEYIYSLNSFTKVARGIFHLMQHCLIYLNPEKGLMRFLNWLDTNNTIYNSKIDFSLVVEDWLKAENAYIQVGIEQSTKHCKHLLDYSEKYKDSNDLNRVIHKITSYALDNITTTRGGSTLFNLNDDFENLDFWKDKIKNFGTGLVRYLDTVVIHGSEKHSNEMQECFTFLISSSLVIKKLIGNKIKQCPFLYDIPICKAIQRDSDNCIANPFLILENENGESCLFRGGVVLTGMTDRIKFDN